MQSTKDKYFRWNRTDRGNQTMTGRGNEELRVTRSNLNSLIYQQLLLIHYTAILRGEILSETDTERQIDEERRRDSVIWWASILRFKLAQSKESPTASTTRTSSPQLAVIIEFGPLMLFLDNWNFPDRWDNQTCQQIEFVAIFASRTCWIRGLVLQESATCRSIKFQYISIHFIWKII